MADACIHLHIGGKLVAIRHRAIRPQARSHQHIRAEHGGAPAVGRARRHADILLVIEMNVVLRDIGKIARIEAELARRDIFAHRLFDGKIRIGREGIDIIGRRQFRAILLAARIIERRQNDRRAELAFVDQVLGYLVIGIHAQGHALRDLLVHTRIEIVGAFGAWRVVQQKRGGCRGAHEFLHRRIGHKLEGRWREIARVARVNSRPVKRLPHGIDARAQLVLVEKPVELVEPHPIVQRKARRDLPFVLKINAIGPGLLAAVVRNVDRHIIGRVARRQRRAIERIVERAGSGARCG